MREEIENTLQQVKEDLITAKANIEIKRYYASAFFSHQAAEKALQVSYMLKFRKLLSTHNLIELCKELKCPEKVKESARRLNPSYMIARYVHAANGVPARMYNEELATARLNNAEVILKWAENSIK